MLEGFKILQRRRGDLFKIALSKALENSYLEAERPEDAAVRASHTAQPELFDPVPDTRLRWPSVSIGFGLCYMCLQNLG